MIRRRWKSGECGSRRLRRRLALRCGDSPGQTRGNVMVGRSQDCDLGVGLSEARALDLTPDPLAVLCPAGFSLSFRRIRRRHPVQVLDTRRRPSAGIRFYLGRPRTHLRAGNPLSLRSKLRPRPCTSVRARVGRTQAHCTHRGSVRPDHCLYRVLHVATCISCGTCLYSIASFASTRARRGVRPRIADRAMHSHVAEERTSPCPALGAGVHAGRCLPSVLLRIASSASACSSSTLR